MFNYDMERELDLTKVRKLNELELEFKKISKAKLTPLEKKETLTKLLLNVDSVLSDGDTLIRKKRKVLVNRINAAIEQLELTKT